MWLRFGEAEYRVKFDHGTMDVKHDHALSDVSTLKDPKTYISYPAGQVIKLTLWVKDVEVEYYVSHGDE